MQADFLPSEPPGKPSISFSLSTVNVLGRVADFCEGCPFHYRMFSSVPGLDASRAHSPPPSCGKQKCLCQMSPEE